MRFKFRSLMVTGLMLAVLGIAVSSLADMLGIVPGFPLMSYEGQPTSGQIINGTLSVSATPGRLLMTPAGPLVPVSSPSSLDINMVVNPTTCALVSGVTGPDLIITGTVDLGGGDVRTGSLLTGEVLQFADGDPSGTIDPFDFRFQVTGGSLSDFYTNEDNGVTLNIENFLFTGDCSGSYEGKPKGQVGPIPPIMDAEGCTPGYWKQPHHFDSWVGYAPDDWFAAIFDRTVTGVTDLESALRAKGGGVMALTRQATAALLNVDSPDVYVTAYSSTADVIAAFQAAYDSGDYEATKDAFEEANEEGCTLD